MNNDYFVCKSCWHVYDHVQLTKGPYDACVCGSHAFLRRDKTLFNKMRAFLTDWKYFVLGETLYDK